jgi:hypothetical protein
MAVGRVGMFGAFTGFIAVYSSARINQDESTRTGPAEMRSLDAKISRWRQS